MVDDTAELIKKDGYEIEILFGDPSSFEADDDNVDVTVIFEDGRLGQATFVTIKNIQTLMERYKETDECDSGRFFFCHDMIIVKSLTAKVIEQTVEALLASGEFSDAFFVFVPESE